MVWIVFIVVCMFIVIVVFILIYVLKGNMNNIIFFKLYVVVEKVKVERINWKLIKIMLGKIDFIKLDYDVFGYDNESDEFLIILNEFKEVDLGDIFDIIDSIDILKKGLFVYFWYNLEECKIVFFYI